MKPDNNSPFNFDDPDAFDQLDNVFDQTKSIDQPKSDDIFLDDTFSLDDNSEIDLGEDSEFNFEPPESNDLNESDEAIADLTEPVRLMECVCPKCAEKTEVDLALMPADGFVTTCSSCNKQIHIIRESCACRAKRKSYEINCANCGKLLDQQVHCHSCGTNFPDFFVTFNPEDARRKSRNEFFSQKWASIRDFKLSFRPAFNSASQEVKPGYSPERRAFDTATSSSTLISRKFAVLAISLIVAVALVAAGLFAYNSNKAEKKYAENYFKALYCFKTGIDSNLKTLTLLKTDWESATKTGLKFTPRISSKDETKAGNLRNEADKYIQKISEPPKKFALANEYLIKVQSIYLDTESLIQSKPNSPLELNISVEALNKKMILASQELKSNLPDTLKKELEITKLKYRGMKDF